MMMKLIRVSVFLLHNKNIVDGPKKPNSEFDNLKIIIGAASTYIAQDLTLSPECKGS